MEDCPDGSQVPETEECLCPDGATSMPSDGICRCPDNSLVPTNGVCVGATKSYLEGTVIPVGDDCMKMCRNGVEVLESADCYCSNGLIEPVSGPCDVTCPASATNPSVATA